MQLAGLGLIQLAGLGLILLAKLGLIQLAGLGLMQLAGLGLKGKRVNLCNYHYFFSYVFLMLDYYWF